MVTEWDLMGMVILMGCSGNGFHHKWGHPNSWLVSVMENPNLEMDDDLGLPPFLETPLIGMNNLRKMLEESTNRSKIIGRIGKMLVTEIDKKW